MDSCKQYTHVKAEKQGGIMNTTRTSRRDFLKIAGLTTAGLSLGGCQMPKTVRDGPDRPNVVVIFTDDQRWDCVGIMPKPLLGMKTPHLDFVEIDP